MGRIDNEIVKFIAEIELDPQKAAEATAALEAAEQRCAKLRDTISKTAQKMDELRAAGKENTKEYKQLDEEMKQLVEDMKEATKEADKHAATLSLNQMSYNQLQKHAKQLRQALNSMHKESNPKVWNAYNKELKATQKRMNEVKAGSVSFGEKLGGAFKGALPKITAAGIAIAAVNAVIKLGKAFLKEAVNATQVWGDKWQEVTAQAKAGWSQFVRDLTLGHGIHLSNIKEAAAAAKKAQQIRDENFERTNSYMLQEAKMRQEIADLETQAYDKSRSAASRKTALDQAVEKEQQLAKMRKENAERMQQAALIELATSTKLNEEELKSFIERYQLDQEKIDAAEEYNEKLKRRDELVSYIEKHEDSTKKKTMEQVEADRKELADLNKELADIPDNIRQIGGTLTQYNWGNDSQVKNYVEATLGIYQADADAAEAEKAAARKRAQLQQQMYSEDIAAVEAWQTSRQNILKKQLLNQEITQEQYQQQSYQIEVRGLEKKKGVAGKYSKEIAGMDKTIANLSAQILDKQLGYQNQETAALEKANRENVNALKKQLLDGEISQQEYQERSEALQESFLRDKKAIMEKYGQDVSTIDSQILDHQIATENRAIDVLNTAYSKASLLLKQQLMNREITQDEYDARARAAEVAHLEQEKAIREKFGEDTTELEAQILERREELQEQYRQMMLSTEQAIESIYRKSGAVMSQAIKDYLHQVKASITEADLRMTQEDLQKLQQLVNSALTKNVSRQGKLDQATREFDEDSADLQQMYDLQLISEEEFQKRKQELIREYTKKNVEIQTEAWVKAFDTAAEMMDAASKLSSALQEAEYAQVEAWKEKELALVGDNADEQARIEEEAEAKKLEIQKKYADVDMAINIAKTIANGAVAAIKAFADLGPIAGGIMAGILAATTIAEVATIIAQRNAIQNAAPGAAAASSGESSVVGFSEGGYTGAGGRREPAGIVHRGEYVVAAPELRDPDVARQVAAIEQKRIARLGGRRAHGAGYAEGGYTDNTETPETAQASEIDSILHDILSVVLDIYETPIPAYMYLSTYEATKARQERSKKFTSLKRKQG